MPPAAYVTRFAPSPTGFLHLGHAFSAFEAFEHARAHDGRFLLRIEDIDQGRRRPRFETALLEDLDWLGLAWESPVRRQSEHLQQYESALGRLITRNVVYRCFRTRREIMEAIASAPHGGLGEPLYVGDPDELSEDEIAARVAAGETFAWRLSSRACADLFADRPLVFEEALSATAGPGTHRVRFEEIGDPVLARKDAGTSYHLACVHDDALQGVTHITRGEDLFASTPLHRLLQALLDLPTPVYRHHTLILGADGKRLSKRNGAPALRDLRAAGETPQQIRERLCLNSSKD
jgi:glutamyl-Q tRNA(Asp) synthetase